MHDLTMMNRRTRLWLMFTVLIAALFVAPAPANAEASCSSSDYDRSTGLATANCRGPGQMKFIVRCLTQNGGTIWEDESAWYNVPSGATMVHRFSTCSGPKSNIVIGVR